MSRDYKLYLEDILESIRKIEKYTQGLTYEKFVKDALIVDGAVRNLEIIGEAVKHLPLEIKKMHSSIDWRKLASLRNILAHEYFGVNSKIIWDVINNKLPKLKETVIEIHRNF